MSHGLESGLSVLGCPDSRWTGRALLRSEDPEERQQREKGRENVSRCSGETVTSALALRHQDQDTLSAVEAGNPGSIVTTAVLLALQNRLRQ